MSSALQKQLINGSKLMRAGGRLSKTSLLRTTKRNMSSFNGSSSSHGHSNSYKKASAIAFAGLSASVLAVYLNSQTHKTSADTSGPTPHSQQDYQKVYNAIAKRIQDKDEWDDGSYGPLLVRLAWHASGTFEKETKTGGSSAGTMRFQKEYGTDSNAGLVHGKEFLEPIHEQFPWLSYGDLYTLGGVTAVQELGGPKIKWRPGRLDADESQVPADGRLPDASQGCPHIRSIFYRMGFSDREIVALIGAHCLGRCHTQNSGYDGPWTFSPTYFTNDFFTLLLNEKWHIRKWNGPEQYEDDKTNSLMMLPADYALLSDKSFKKWVEAYAKDSDLFFKDFSAAFSRLLELGVNYNPGVPQWEFKTLDEQ